MMTPAVSIARARPPIATHKPNTPMMAKKKAMPITTVVSTPATFRATLGFGCDICHPSCVRVVRSTTLQSLANITCTKQYMLMRFRLNLISCHLPRLVLN